MSVGLNRASVFAITEETTAGTYVAPTTGAQFVPLRPGNEISYEPEQLESDEVQNDIGASKSFVGKEAIKGKHSAYLKHSGVEGQEPELGILYESLMGSKNIVSVEGLTASSSTTSVIKVPTGEGADYVQGQALLVKKADGYKIVNIASISGDDLTLNFKLDSAPSSSIGLGKAITYLPVAQGHPTFSTTKYLGNGFAKEVSAGNTVTEVAFKMDANGFGEANFAFEGVKYYFNPIEITASNKWLDFTDDYGTWSVAVAEKIYKTPIELADALQSAMNTASVEPHVVSFSSVDGKFTISSQDFLSLLWSTGTHTANSIGTKLGFVVSANDTGSLTYTSDNAQVYTSAITPSYDNADAIIIKGAELFIGNQSDNICFCAQSVSLTIAKTVEDVDCICEESGILEKIPTSRTATMEISAALKKHQVDLLDALLKNSGISAMMNCGPKTGGSWVAGKCFNSYLQKCTVSKYTTSGDSFITVNLSLKGYVTSSEKDVYFNFI